MWVRYKRKNNDYTRPSRMRSKNYEIIAHRMFKDFQTFVDKHPHLHVVQLDSVVGQTTDTLALMTIHFPDSNFMFGFMYRKGNALSYLRRFQCIQNALGEDVFFNLFPIMLCDNGSETALVHELEVSPSTGEVRSNVFYCDPYNSWQKGSLERNHHYVRRVIPKGRSLNKYTDEFIALMFSHINATPREIFENKTPYDLFKAKYGVSVLEKLGIKYISPFDVDLHSLRFLH